MKKLLIASACILMMQSVANAQTSTPVQSSENPVRVFAGIGLAFGGDNLAYVSYTNGSKAKISAGTGLVLLGGVDYRLTEDFSVQGTVGYHARFTPEASNGSATFSRIPVELLGLYKVNEQWRVGGGIRSATNVKLSASGAVNNLNTSFDTTLGPVVEAEYFFNDKSSVKIRAVSEKYKITGYSDSYSGSHIAATYNYYF